MMHGNGAAMRAHAHPSTHVLHVHVHQLSCTGLSTSQEGDVPFTLPATPSRGTRMYSMMAKESHGSHHQGHAQARLTSNSWGIPSCISARSSISSPMTVTTSLSSPLRTCSTHVHSKLYCTTGVADGPLSPMQQGAISTQQLELVPGPGLLIICCRGFEDVAAEELLQLIASSCTVQPQVVLHKGFGAVEVRGVDVQQVLPLLASLKSADKVTLLIGCAHIPLQQLQDTAPGLTGRERLAPLAHVVAHKHLHTAWHNAVNTWHQAWTCLYTNTAAMQQTPGTQQVIRFRATTDKFGVKMLDTRDVSSAVGEGALKVLRSQAGQRLAAQAIGHVAALSNTLHTAQVGIEGQLQLQYVVNLKEWDMEVLGLLILADMQTQHDSVQQTQDNPTQAVQQVPAQAVQQPPVQAVQQVPVQAVQHSQAGVPQQLVLEAQQLAVQQTQYSNPVRVSTALQTYGQRDGMHCESSSGLEPEDLASAPEQHHKLLLGLVMTQQMLASCAMQQQQNALPGWSRTWKFSGGRTPLRSTTAYCLARLAGVRPGDVVVDPCCGVGTIPLKAAAAWPDATYIAGDVDAEALECAELNRQQVAAALAEQSRTPAHVQFQCWDASNLPLESGSIDLVISDLPWGIRELRPKEGRTSPSLRKLYPKLFRELARVLKPGSGRAVLISGARTLMRGAMAEQGVADALQLLSQRELVIGGLPVCLYSLQRTHKDFQSA